MRITSTLAILACLALLVGCSGYSQQPQDDLYGGDHGPYVGEGDRPAGYFLVPKEEGGGGTSLGGVNRGSNSNMGSHGRRRIHNSRDGFGAFGKGRVIPLDIK